MEENENITAINQDIAETPTVETITERQSSIKVANAINQAETTYEDIFTELGKRLKGEGFEKLKNDYAKQFASSISKKKIDDVRFSLMEEYANINSEILAEKKAEAKLQEKIQQNNLETKAFLEKNGLSELTDEELEEAINYGTLTDVTDKELAKTNPAIAKMIKEATAMAKAKNKPLPQNTKSLDVPSITQEEFDKIKARLFTRAHVSEEERKKFNLNTKFYIK